MSFEDLDNILLGLGEWSFGVVCDRIVAHLTTG